MDNVNNEVSLQFTNVVEGTKELNDYEERLNRIKNIIQTFPKNFTLGGHDYTNQINKTNTLLLHLNKNLLNTKNLFNGILGGEKNSAIKFRQVLNGINTNTQEVGKSFDNLGEKINLAFNYTTLKTFLRGLKRITQTMSGLVKKASDYGEDINLFQVAFDYTYQDAERFVNKMSEMYGLDEDWLTRTTGIFKQLSNAMSLSTEEGTKLSELMTQMSLDISSLYNLDVDRGSSVLQSALAGQTKPIRGATGADITQATLQQTLNELGIDQSITNLSYAEKRLIIIISLTRQLQASVGDMAKTLNLRQYIEMYIENFVNLCKKGVNIILKIIFANDKELQEI